MQKYAKAANDHCVGSSKSIACSGSGGSCSCTSISTTGFLCVVAINPVIQGVQIHFVLTQKVVVKE